MLEATGSAAWLSAVTTTALIPTVATMLLGGGIADRYRRDKVLYLTSLGAGVSQAGLAILLAAVSFLAGVAAEFFTVAWTTVTNMHIPEWVPMTSSGRSWPCRSASSRPHSRVGTFGTTIVALFGGAFAAAAMLAASSVPSLRRISVR